MVFYFLMRLMLLDHSINTPTVPTTALGNKPVELGESRRNSVRLPINKVDES